ncbi:MAG: type II toxin-antitoxin system HicB family antitoxin [Verrucomicrobiales bacterium]
MKTLSFTYWQDASDWIGYLDDFPDYSTQGSSFEDLKEHLLDLYRELSSGAMPNVRRRAELEVA